MDDKILFMIIGDEVKYLAKSTMDHREWFVSLGYDSRDFESVIRGFIIENKIIFFKGINFNYDEEVINAAKTFAPVIRKALHNQYVEVYCGIVINSFGEKWEPVLKINDDEILDYEEIEKRKKEQEEKLEKERLAKEKNQNKEVTPFIELKNDYTDDLFIKRAIIITIVVLILTIFSKVLLFSDGSKLRTDNRMDTMLVFLQVVTLGATLYGYKKKLSYAKYTGIIASCLIVLSFDILDLIIGVVYFLFNIDSSYFGTMKYILKEQIKRIKEKKKS